MTDFTVGTGTSGTVTLRLTQSSQDISGNTSTDSWALYLSSSYSGTYSNGVGWSANINGNTFSGSFSYNFNNYSSLLIASGTVVVGHNADGTKAISVSGGIGATGTSSIGGPATASGTFTQSTIPRASTATLSPATLDAGTVMTINTNRASSSFTHTIRYSFGSLSGTIASGVTDTTTWTPPLSLLSQVPNGLLGQGPIYVDTYNGGTLIGTTSVGYGVTVPASVVPTIAGITCSEATAGVAASVGAYVQSVSTLALGIAGPAGAYGSTIVSQKLTADGQVITSGSGTTGAISSTGTVGIVATVTDSRGRTSSQLLNVNVLSYSTPTINLGTVSAKRADSSGNLLETGDRILVNLSAAVGSLVNGVEKNSLTYKVFTRARGATSWVANSSAIATGVTFTGTSLIATFVISSSWEVLVQVVDLFRTVQVQLLVPTSVVLVHWDNVGMGVGKFREQGTVDTSGQMYQNNGQVVASVGSAFKYLPAPVSSSVYYTRIATVYGYSGSQGADMEFILSGNGGIGSTSRGTVLVHVTQRGTNVIDVQSWGFGIDQIGDTKFGLYSRQIDAYTFEVWMQGSDYQTPQGITILGGLNYVFQCDSPSTTAPTSLVSYPIGAGAEPVGTISLNAATSGTPRGWLFCAGQAISRITYARLFAVCGTAYGAGDGTTTFNIPNLMGRIPVTYDGSAEFSAVGQTGGEKAHTLTVSEMPSHDHEIQRSNVAASGQGVDTSTVYRSSANSGATYARTQNNGGGAAHNNLQPYIVINYNIKY